MSFLPCTTNLDCPSSAVCDTSAGRCAQCFQDGDCNPGQKCIASTCRPGCPSGSECTPLGLFCDSTSGACAECLTDANCAQSEYCNQGTCALDNCTAGSQYCTNNAIATCSANGGTLGTPSPCSARQTCVVAGGAAQCKPWVCTPGASECQNTLAIQCSADGFTVLSATDCSLSGLFCVGSGTCAAQFCAANTYFCNGNQVDLCSADGLSSTLYIPCLAGTYCDSSTNTCATQICTPGQPACNNNVATTCNSNGSGYLSGGTDCTATGGVCSAGVCRTLVCQPNAQRCQGSDVIACSADGLSESIVDTCTSSEYCDTGTGTCKPRVCTPNQPACDGNVATTCNAAGSGYTGLRTDCSLSALTCGAGVCTTCPGGNGAVDAVRLQEVQLGNTDYVALRNTSTQCPANLAGLDLVMLDSDTTFFTLNWVFSSQTIAPGETVYVFENTSGTAPTDINVGVNIGFSGSRGGWVVLCVGSCTTSTASNAVDAIAFASSDVGTNQQPPALPVPLTFSPLLTAIGSANQSTTSYIRSQVSGVAPNFTSADWTLGTPTR